jgi:hypothetical protein
MIRRLTKIPPHRVGEARYGGVNAQAVCWFATSNVVS